MRLISYSRLDIKLVYAGAADGAIYRRSQPLIVPA